MTTTTKTETTRKDTAVTTPQERAWLKRQRRLLNPYPSGKVVVFWSVVAILVVLAFVAFG